MFSKLTGRTQLINIQIFNLAAQENSCKSPGSENECPLDSNTTPIRSYLANHIPASTYFKTMTERGFRRDGAKKNQVSYFT